jgi:NAD(P)-dependent dehydrogenase (short-subunit alcohol dehydrogenase family)
MNRFDGKVVMVTGAASGIGLASATEFAKEGGTVVATDVNAAALEAAAAGLKAEGLSVEAAVLDVTDRAAWDDCVDGIVGRHGRLDVLFNNAGIGDFVSVENTTMEQWRAVNAVNQDGMFFGMQAAIRVMKAGGGGAIVNNSSIAAIVGEPMLTAYAATKGAVRAMTKAAAVDCARQRSNIRINSIHAGFTGTALVARTMESLGDQAEAAAAAAMERVPIGRLGEPREIARGVLFLASDDASFMIGSELVMDGGWVAS